MKFSLHPHAKARLAERGATESEVEATVADGERFPAKFGRTGFRRNFAWQGEWRGKSYATKQITAFAVEEADDWLVIPWSSSIFEPMKLTYDPRYNVAYLSFQEKVAQGRDDPAERIAQRRYRS